MRGRNLLAVPIFIAMINTTYHVDVIHLSTTTAPTTNQKSFLGGRQNKGDNSLASILGYPC